MYATDRIEEQLKSGKDIFLFLDYDGTLAEFTATPEIVQPDTELISLIMHLSHHPQVRVAIISGRRLGHVRDLLPIPGIILAGTYGVEMLLTDGEEITRVKYQAIRPVIERMKPLWEQLIEGKKGFYIEDKGWAVALHAKGADNDEAFDVISKARSKLKQYEFVETYRILSGYKFLEIGPVLADKGETVKYLIDRFGKSDDLNIYMGDDDKDEEAFKIIKEYGGLTVIVGPRQTDIPIDLRLPGIKDARDWLLSLSNKVYNTRQD